MKIIGFLLLYFITILSTSVEAQITGLSFSSVYSEKPGSTSALWGHNASKACVANNIRFTVSREENTAYRRPMLYADSGNGWSTRWTGSVADVKQNPVVVCDVNNNVHVIYNRSNGSLAHYRFEAPYTVPLLVSTSRLPSYAVHYLAAAASLTDAQIYVAGCKYCLPGTNDEFNVYRYLDSNKTWWGPYPQILKFPSSGGFRDDAIANKSRDDGSYLYPVISANGHRVFTAAALLQHHNDVLYPNNEDYVWRKHWVLWDAASYGQKRINHYYKDAAPGSKPYFENSITNQYYVAPEAIKQTDEGVLYILSTIRGAPISSGLNAQYLTSHINGLEKRVKIPSAQGLSGMTAKGDMVIVVDKSRIHWSCDKGDTWQNQLHLAEDHVTNTGTRHSRGYTHVMSDLYNDVWIDAFYGIQYRDIGSTAENPVNTRAEIINIRFNTSSLCIN